MSGPRFGNGSRRRNWPPTSRMLLPPNGRLWLSRRPPPARLEDGFMKGGTTMVSATPVIHRTVIPSATGAEARLADIRSYYNAVADDYRAWSPGMNMHFGYWSWKVNPFAREAMLERMNLE